MLWKLECVRAEQCFEQGFKVVGDYCYEVCPIGTFENGNYCTGSFIGGSDYIHLIEFDEIFAINGKQLTFPFDDSISSLYNLKYPLEKFTMITKF